MTDKPTELAYKVNRWIDPQRWGVVRRSSYPCCRLLALPIADRRGGARGHDTTTMGEDLKVGCCLTRGLASITKSDSLRAQNPRRRDTYILRYDVEVSGLDLTCPAT